MRELCLIGTGAAGIATSRLLFTYGIKPENTIFVDSKATLHTGRTDLEENQSQNPYKWDLCLKTNPERRTGGIPEALKGADVCISFSKPVPGVIKPEWVKEMNKDAILFPCANPIPEIWPWEAKEAGARIIATGRSDFPNQVNNSVVFPAIFRGVLDVQAKTITNEMCIAAAYELARYAEDRGISEEYIIPTMEDWEVFVREAVAVGLKAIEQGVAREKLSREELTKRAEKMIKESRETVATLMEAGLILPMPQV